jgi:GntR family transcriptional regulator
MADNIRTLLLFEIKPGSGIPIYRQIIEQVRRLVASGALKAGDELPSIRQAASHYEINPMTISKAYSLLENDGVLEHVRGGGMRVAAKHTEARAPRKRMDLLRPALREVATQANQLGLSRKEVLEALSAYLEDNDEQ